MTASSVKSIKTVRSERTFRPQAAIPDFGRIAIEHPCDRPRCRPCRPRPRRSPSEALDEAKAAFRAGVGWHRRASSLGLKPYPQLPWQAHRRMLLIEDSSPSCAQVQYLQASDIPLRVHGRYWLAVDVAWVPDLKPSTDVGITRDPSRPCACPTHAPNGGVADSLDDAKAAFRAAWEAGG
jgi:hypothetical protein